ncbi:uncharacterized protein LOC112127794 [Cimex lectularius]|uniref:Uncharacterized protein n=1 Tax=Cimex lectularius TaxID=79782 RepID=A0A8I6TMR6_CIMLE|nr:uncharacterized protein LOC112127794 [Cimex lectularius]
MRFQPNTISLYQKMSSKDTPTDPAPPASAEGTFSTELQFEHSQDKETVGPTSEKAAESVFKVPKVVDWKKMSGKTKKTRYTEKMSKIAVSGSPRLTMRGSFTPRKRLVTYMKISRERAKKRKDDDKKLKEVTKKDGTKKTVKKAPTLLQSKIRIEETFPESTNNNFSHYDQQNHLSNSFVKSYLKMSIIV